MRLVPSARSRNIIDAALKAALAHPGGYMGVTREKIAEVAQCSPGLVSRYLGTMDATRRTIMREAIRAEALKIIAQGLAVRDRTALKAPEELKARALATLG